MTSCFPGGASGIEPACQCRRHERCQIRSLGREAHLEGSMATHSSILVWEIPWTEEPGGLGFIGSQRVGWDWSELARMHWLPPRSIVLTTECLPPCIFSSQNTYILWVCFCCVDVPKSRTARSSSAIVTTASFPKWWYQFRLLWEVHADTVSFFNCSHCSACTLASHCGFRLYLSND